MEKRGIQKSNLALCMAIVVMLMAAQPSQAFIGCYGKCFLTCSLTFNIATCALKCMVECINPPSNFNTHDELCPGGCYVMGYFCKLGCSASLCTNISTKADPAEVKVNDCVDSCSEMCSNSKH
ncbi:hypothetical protein SAY87_011572 [Trapa incisa]|uniref:Thionin-like protein 2 n=1 Tax=Trapa incisa TaxID=236973 RepID=A0AAN7GLC0_9MYRT|nr:hypothetical protein SAY87_011572 [Trapa incisa]